MLFRSGAACGKVVFTAEDAEAWNARGEKVILVRLETSPEDITGMKASQGILTVRGGMTSHAAVVARGMGMVSVFLGHDVVYIFLVGCAVIEAYFCMMVHIRIVFAVTHAEV